MSAPFQQSKQLRAAGSLGEDTDLISHERNRLHSDRPMAEALLVTSSTRESGGSASTARGSLDLGDAFAPLTPSAIHTTLVGGVMVHI